MAWAYYREIWRKGQKPKRRNGKKRRPGASVRAFSRKNRRGLRGKKRAYKKTARAQQPAQIRRLRPLLGAKRPFLAACGSPSFLLRQGPALSAKPRRDRMNA